MQATYPPILQEGEFLLGFSGGADSVALFFYLLHKQTRFDIAIIDYGIRPESQAEVSYAKSLAAKHHKQCFHTKAPRFASNFEAQARAFRYDFFSSLIATRGYKGLLLAHNFNDRIEWLLMRLGKGSGIAGLLGFDEITWHYPAYTVAQDDTAESKPQGLKKEAKKQVCETQADKQVVASGEAAGVIESRILPPSAPQIHTQPKPPTATHHNKASRKSPAPYPIIRPLLWASKQEILEYCSQLGLTFFTDSSNANPVYERNFIRTHCADTLIARYGAGLRQSLRILQQERSELYHGGFSVLTQASLVCVYAFSAAQAVHHIASALKIQGYVPSRKQRAEISRTNFSCEIFAKNGGERFCIDHFPSPSHPLTLLVTKRVDITLPKQVKNELRSLHIPPRLRPSLYALSLKESSSIKQCVERLLHIFASVDANPV